MNNIQPRTCTVWTTYSPVRVQYMNNIQPRTCTVWTTYSPVRVQHEQHVAPYMTVWTAFSPVHLQYEQHSVLYTYSMNMILRAINMTLWTTNIIARPYILHMSGMNSLHEVCINISLSNAYPASRKIHMSNSPSVQHKGQSSPMSTQTQSFQVPKYSKRLRGNTTRYGCNKDKNRPTCGGGVTVHIMNANTHPMLLTWLVELGSMGSLTPPLMKKSK